ncbi:unnamed protein product [Schistosoma margrebowiei]|uniref:DNA primase large subunit C-terminal domain-containing protein n=1 Tax=Schistosoma margrebowiei TaxID=48269 RepID=A0A183LL99_9TREM|nr:unnamed protein product [Schistosoma margrebowiei]
MSNKSNGDKKSNAVLIDADFPGDPLSTSEIVNKFEENISEESNPDDLKSNAFHPHHLGIGLPLEESLKFWRKSFSPKYDNDQFNKAYAYNIRHNYGKEGKRADYTPYSCIRVISIFCSAPGAGDYHGCPFRHMDPELLRQRLLSGGRLSLDIVETIVQRTKERLYHLSCREYLRGMLKLSVDDISGITIHHPNQYFEEARKIIQGNKNNPTVDKIHVKKVKLYNGDDDDRLLQAIDINDASFTSSINGNDSLIC